MVAGGREIKYAQPKQSRARGSMTSEREEIREAYLVKARHEINNLVERGVVMDGNAFSSVLLIKGDFENSKGAQAEKSSEHQPLLSDAESKALHAALQALGYAPEDWMVLSTVCTDGGNLENSLLREAITTLDPETLVLLDEPAAASVREAYAAELAELPNFDDAMLRPGTLATILGMRVLALGGFAAALGDSHQKQIMWHYLKSIPPLGEPY